MTGSSGHAGRLGEFELIARYFAPLSRKAPGAFALTDDVALLECSPGCELVVKTDAIVAGVHFHMEDPPELVGRKALRVNFSDLAAKGARPVAFTQAIVLNDSIDESYLARYAQGLAADVEEFNIPLIGGDTTASAGPFTIAVTAFGEVPRGSAILRSGARPGDIIYVSGTIGDAALGLLALQKKLDLSAATGDALISRYHLPQPRVPLGMHLRGGANASADVSDGLVADVDHIAAASGVAAIIDRSKIPLSAAAHTVLSRYPEAWEDILTGGDDYEIVAAIAPENTNGVIRASEATATLFTAIGQFTTGTGTTVFSEDGKPVRLSTTGYRHR